MRDSATPGSVTSAGERPAVQSRRHPRPRRWDVALVIAAGGALGAVARYELSVLLPYRTGEVPWGTLAVNVVGCLLIGVLMVVLTEVVGRPHRLLRPFWGVGVLGGFTTFSTYTVETQQMVAWGAPELAAAYLFGTLAAALAAVEVGIAVTRLLARARRRRSIR